MLLSNTESEEGRESLEQAKGLLWPLQNELDRLIQNSHYAPYLKRKLGWVGLIDVSVKRYEKSVISSTMQCGWYLDISV